jgi:hypothetical protein
MPHVNGYLIEGHCTPVGWQPGHALAQTGAQVVSPHDRSC